jgi:hypothetical protein
LVYSVFSSTPDTGTVPVAIRYKSIRPLLAKDQGGLLLKVLCRVWRKGFRYKISFFCPRKAGVEDQQVHSRVYTG